MTWITDPAHTNITFAVRHMMISNVYGRFENFEITAAFDPENPAATTVDVKIDANSINTREEKRDAHLRSADFLNAEAYPFLTFRSERVELLGDNHARLHGALTIRDVTRPVALDVVYNGLIKSPWGATSAGFSASTSINRKDWGLNWNVALEAGGWLVDDTIKILAEVELIQQTAPVAESAAAAG